METHFKVLVSSNIKRKKPWRRIEWIGQAKESVCLIDRYRASLLYLPSGHTKRVIDVLRPYKKDFTFITTSSSGGYVVACLKSGDILRWHKDSNAITIIPACPDFTLLSGKKSVRIHLFISDDGRKIVAILQRYKVNVWEQVGFGDEGEWTNVGLDAKFLNSLSSRDGAIDGRFFTNLVQGQCFLCCFAFTNNLNVNICLLLLQWCDDAKRIKTAPLFTSTMSRSFLSLQDTKPICVPLKLRGCYVPCLSHDGRMLALAVNQLQPYLTTIMFVDVYHNAAIVTNQQHVYVTNVKSSPTLAKTYWIKMMSWSHDDLYLYCINGRGSLLVYSRVGQPMMSSTHGMGVELGPSFLLPIHPLVQAVTDLKFQSKDNRRTTRPNSPVSMASTMESERSLKQKFSITTHPRLPILMCSDGYMVTALQMTTVVTSYDIAALSLVETNHQLKILNEKFNLKVQCNTTPRYGDPLPVLDETKFKEYKYTRLYLYIKKKFKRKKEDKETINQDAEHATDDTFNSLAYEFEKAEKEMGTDTEPESLDETYKHPSGVVENADQGKVTFGDYSLTFDEQILSESADAIIVEGESLLKHIKVCATKLLHVFVLLIFEDNPFAVPDSSLINDKLHQYFVDSLYNLCDLIIAAQEISRCLPWRLVDVGFSERSFRKNFGQLMRDVARNFSFLVQFNRGNVGLVSKSVEVIVEGILKLRDTAPEGCCDADDVQHNLASASRVLCQVENHLRQSMSFHSTSNHLDQHQLLDVNQHFHVYSSSHTVLPCWEKFYSFASTWFSSLPSVQKHPSMHKLLRLLQSYLPEPILLQQVNVIGTPVTLTNMSNNLMAYQLDSALILASFVLHDHLSAGSKWSESGWKAIDLLCDVMNLYFTKQPIKFLSPVNSSRREIFLHSDIITTVSSVNRLSKLWNVNECVRLLLMCGRVQEATRLADDVGSWKAALCIAAVVEKVRAFKQDESSTQSPVFKLLKNRFKSLVPSWTLHYDDNDDNVDDSDETSIDDDDLSEQLFDYQPEHSAALFVDLFIAAVMTGYDVAVWGASLLLSELKNNCKKLPLLEDDDVYLPSPPLYLPQPSPDQNKRQKSVLRHKISTLLRILLIIFHSAGAMHHMILWYGNKLKKQKPENRTASKSSLGESSNSIVGSESSMLAAVFREMCTVLWMLHAREKLTIAVRKFQNERENMESPLEVVEECLLWCSHLKPFAKYLHSEVELQQLVLCLCSEKVVDRYLVAILAYYFCETEKINPKVQGRLSVMIQKLRQTSTPVETKDDEHSRPDQSQPLSVYYQKLCTIMLEKQRNDPSIQQVFVKQNDQLNSNESIFEPELASLSTPFSFENEHSFLAFIAQLFDVISSKSDAMIRGLRREGFSKFPTKILVVGNRNVIAVHEVKQAMTHMEQRKYSSSGKGNDSVLLLLPDNTPNKDSTEPQVRVADVIEMQPSEADTETVKAMFLRRFFSDLIINKHSSTNQLELVESIQRRLEKCGEFEIADIFPTMQKRFYRLLPYLTWLQYWSERDVATKNVISKPSMRVDITRQQLLQSLFVAEIRFGGYSPETVNNIISRSSSTLTLTLTTTEEQESKQIEPSSDVEVDDKPNESEEKSKKSTPTVIVEDINQSITPGTMEDVSEIANTIEKNDLEVEVDQEEAEKEGQTELEETAPKTIVSDDEKRCKKEKLSVKSLTRVQKVKFKKSIEDDSDSTQQQPDDKTVDELADGGSPKTRSSRSLHPSRSDIAGIVQGEIHNVLLAQQVSLLSQILLGQTMVRNDRGTAQMSNIADILNNLQGSRPQPPENKHLQKNKVLDEKTSTSDLDKENIRPSFDGTLTIGHLAHTESPPRTRKSYKPAVKQQSKFAIPLLHVPGISKSYDPMIPDLMKTPKSKQAWAASSISKGKNPDENRSPSPRLLRSENKLDKQVPCPTCPQQAVRPLLAQLPCKPCFHPIVIPKAPSPLKKSAPAPPPYKTAFPILNKPVDAFVPVKPTFREPLAQSEKKSTPTSFFPQQPVCAPRAPMAYPPAQKPFFATLIDPREVVGYHARKQAFTSIKPRPAFTSIKPIPILHIPHFQPTLKTKEEKTPPKVVEEETTIPKVLEEKPIEREVKDLKENEEEPLEEFKGYLDQEKINAQVQLMVDQVTDNADRKTQPNLHLIAAVGKHIRSTPRMVDASEQVEIMEDKRITEEEEDDSFVVDYKDKLTTKPLQPPPEIFDRIRKEVYSPTKSKTKNDFIHVGDTNIEAVTRGFKQKQMTAAEAHYLAAKRQPPRDLSRFTGLPDDEEGRQHRKRLLSEHIESATKVAQVREVTRDRWTSAMQSMSAQLDAIDAMARDMDADFKNAAKVIRTVEDLEKMISPRLTPKKKSPSPSPINTTSQPEKHIPASSTIRNFPPAKSFPLPESLPPELPLQKNEYKERLKAAFELVSPRKGKTVCEACDVKGFPDDSSSTLRNSSETESSDDEDIEDRAAQILKDDLSYSDPDLIPNYSPSLEEEDLLYSPRDPHSMKTSTNKRDSTDIKVRPWNERNEDEKQNVRNWMKMKKRERTMDYMEQRKSHQETEANPYRSSSGQMKSTSSLQLASKQREEKKKKMLSNHMMARLTQSKNLLDEMKDDINRKNDNLTNPLRDVNGRRSVTSAPLKKGRPTPYQIKQVSPGCLRDSSRIRKSDDFEKLSNCSIISDWSLNDDVKRILYGSRAAKKKPKKSTVTFNFKHQHVDDGFDARSDNTANLINDIDWESIDNLVASIGSDSMSLNS